MDADAGAKFGSWLPFSVEQCKSPDQADKRNNSDYFVTMDNPMGAAIRRELEIAKAKYGRRGFGDPVHRRKFWLNGW
ncbi:hypothetical protein [Mesorhizobium sp.]|uniref:hypothetical protein n=1 Tax=Mesorhizobium sp. TaxID=1871066 RepID=UPI000FE82FDC|nr:hypothetical protein [Mesorhizobium sp.]RWK58056.1 MAG: hypothetical protein EOR49_33305 [Mesorhizobium sp.]RWM40973.1 MAG: hypothetical protein EOR76_35185 [Mesorhizobium sp.]RWO22284.1 MAG: hypothetical protein EOS10_35115 [Mesorhizobium sp.]TIM82019.1 MAG: hypothetical protein E5Y50_30930 [Mesorhizobium sp.]